MKAKGKVFGGTPFLEISLFTIFRIFITIRCVCSSRLSIRLYFSWAVKATKVLLFCYVDDGSTFGLVITSSLGGIVVTICGQNVPTKI